MLVDIPISKCGCPLGVREWGSDGWHYRLPERRDFDSDEEWERYGSAPVAIERCPAYDQKVNEERTKELYA